MLYKVTVEAGTLDLIKRLSTDEKFKDFNLVGGTALGLQIGHRMSEDIDLYASRNFDTVELARYLMDNYNAEELHAYRDGLFSFVQGVKVDIIRHDFNWLAPPQLVENIRLASLEDIAAMKIHAIVNSGARMRDFADIYFLLEHRNLDEILKAYEDKYPNGTAELGKLGLLYYDDISKKTDIHYIDREIAWVEITDRIKEAVVHPDRRFVRERQERPGSEDMNSDQQKRLGRSR